MIRTRDRTDEFSALRRRWFAEMVTKEAPGEGFHCWNVRTGERLGDFSVDLLNRRRDRVLATAALAERWHLFFHVQAPRATAAAHQAEKSLERLTALAALREFASTPEAKEALQMDRLKESTYFAKALGCLERRSLAAGGEDPMRIRLLERFRDAAALLRTAYGRLPRTAPLPE